MTVAMAAQVFPAIRRDPFSSRFSRANASPVKMNPIAVFTFMVAKPEPRVVRIGKRKNHPTRADAPMSNTKVLHNNDILFSVFGRMPLYSGSAQGKVSFPICRANTKYGSSIVAANWRSPHFLNLSLRVRRS